MKLRTRCVAIALRLPFALACAVLVLAAAPLQAQFYQDLYDFDCSSSGCAPQGRLTLGTDGNFYGTTSSGGMNNLGTIFMVNHAGTTYNVLWNFDSSTGEGDGGVILQSTDLNFYGTTSGGGTFGNGTLYKFDASTKTLTILHEFSTTDGVPSGAPVEGKDKNLYGVATIGADPGTFYRWSVGTGTFDILYADLPPAPQGPLIVASDGNLYGVTAFGGKEADAGTLFRMSTTVEFKIIHTFAGAMSDGASPNAPLVQAKNGKLYGTTFSGGENSVGTIFEQAITPPRTESVLFNFDSSGGAGVNPSTGLLAATDGNFYGTASSGGADGVGEIFEFNSGDTYIPLDDFTGNTGGVSGANPNTPMFEDPDGLFYGLTPAGGTDGGGVFYALTPPNPLSNILLCCNWWVILDQPVIVLGNNLNQVIGVNFGLVEATFQPGSNNSSTYLTAKVPSAAIDAPITVTLATGEQVESQEVAHILPKITGLDPSSGTAGTPVSIVGGGFAGTKKVTFGGVAATGVTVVSPALIQATVPPGAVTGKVKVVTPNGSATAKHTFTVN